MLSENHRAQYIDQVLKALSTAAARSEVLRRPIDALECSPRVKGFIKRQRLGTIGDIVVQSEKSFSLAKNGGPDTIEEIKRVLSGEGLSLGTSQARQYNLSDLDGTISATAVNDHPCHKNFSAGAVINFSSYDLATSFSEMARYILTDHDTADMTYDDLIRHRTYLPVQETGEKKIYPIFISDWALGKLNDPDNLEQISKIWQMGAIGIDRG